MCVIIHLPKGKTISWEQLKKCYDRNSDGYGIMAAIDGKVKVIRSIGSFEKFREDWKTIPVDVERAIHFRWKTHGVIDVANCHPFQLTGTHILDRDGQEMQPYDYPDIFLMHNGIIKTLEIDKTMSDTYHFTEFDLGPVTPTYGDAMAHPDFRKCIEDVTSGSKILLMDGTGRVMKTFPNMWTERNGCSFSNSLSLSWQGNNNTWTGGKKNKKKKDRDLDFGDRRYGYDRWEGGSDLYPYGRSDSRLGGYSDAELEAEAREQKDLSILQAMGMSDEDLADYIQEYPWETVDFIRDLLGDVPIGDNCDALADDCDECGDQGGMPVVPPEAIKAAIKELPKTGKDVATSPIPISNITDTQRLARLILNQRAGLAAEEEKAIAGPVKGSAVVNKAVVNKPEAPVMEMKQTKEEAKEPEKKIA